MVALNGNPSARFRPALMSIVATSVGIQTCARAMTSARALGFSFFWVARASAALHHDDEPQPVKVAISTMAEIARRTMRHTVQSAGRAVVAAQSRGKLLLGEVSEPSRR